MRYVQDVQSLAPYIASGFVEYIDWSHKRPYSLQGTLVAAYDDAIHRSSAKWMIFTGRNQFQSKMHVSPFRELLHKLFGGNLKMLDGAQ